MGDALRRQRPRGEQGQQQEDPDDPTGHARRPETVVDERIVTDSGLRIESCGTLPHLRRAQPCFIRSHGTDPLNSTQLATAAQPLPSAQDDLSGTDPLVRTILDSLDDAKAEDVVAIDLRGKTSLADTMVVASGRSTTHVSAIADRVLRQCKTAGTSTRVEGLSNCDWVLVDAGDAIIHIFRPEVRQFYNLEKMWGGMRPEESHAG